MNVKKQADNAVMASRFLADARFQVYLDYARRHVDTVDRERLVDLAVRLYRWNVEASAITIGYIGYIEIFVRNAIDHRLCEWVSGQQITGIPDWLEAGKSDPIGRIRALINSLSATISRRPGTRHCASNGIGVPTRRIQGTGMRSPATTCSPN